MGRLDTRTDESLHGVSAFIETMKCQGSKIACFEEIAYRMGYIDDEQLRRVAQTLRQSRYGDYLLKVVEP